MLDQLIESKSNRQGNKNRGGFLLTTFVLVVGLLFSAVLWSLFAKDLSIGGEEFELSALVAPIPVPENAPQLVVKQLKREQASPTKNEPVVRQANIMRVDETQPAPNEVSVVPNTQKSRPNGLFMIKNGTENEPQGTPSSNFSDGGSGKGIEIQDAQPKEIEDKELIKTPPPIKKSVEETVKKRTTVVSTGVVNGQAISLPKPPYPLAAKAVRASGEVSVQVTIDETGKVISAKAASGHLLLRDAAEKAAWTAKFKPTLLSNQPVKVTGVIVYKFSTQ